MIRTTWTCDWRSCVTTETGEDRLLNPPGWALVEKLTLCPVHANEVRVWLRQNCKPTGAGDDGV
jgi:hypothetical protein